MYSKEEAKRVRQEFWDQFKSWSASLRNRHGKQGRWLMNDTGIKQLKLKFHFDEEFALAGIEIDTKNLDKRIALWGKLESLKPRLEERADFGLIWELDYALEEDKTVSRVFAELAPVNIYNKDDWKKVNSFFYKKMTVFEDFFLEYRDYLKYSFRQPGADQTISI